MLQHIRITESGQRLDRRWTDLMQGQTTLFIQGRMAEGRT